VDFPLRFSLEKYEGPLDLLLDLIRKQQIDIYDIPIAQITAQYLAYVHQMEEQNIELGGEFILMAATLIHIKSRLLLPKDPDVPEDQQEDPRLELVNQLLEHEKFKNAAAMLHEKQMLESASWSNPPMKLFVDDSEEPGLAVSVYDLVKTFQTVLERARNRPSLDIKPEEITTAQMIRRIRDEMARTRAPLELAELFSQFRNRRSLITLFLAILEMVKLQAIVLRQKETFGDIYLRKHKGFDGLYSDRPIEELVGEETPPPMSDDGSEID
jgi:segregation and condensation protein A